MVLSIKEIIEYVIEIGGIDYTQKQIKKFYNSALKDLNLFKESKFKNSLKKLIKYVIEREY